MAYTTIDKPDDYFNTVLYSGTGSDQSVTGTGFTADLIWLKERNGADYHFVNDSVRGKGTNNHYLNLHTNATNAESDQTTGLNAINSNGFDITYRAELNESGKNYVAWNWLAGGTASSNTDGSITSSVSANTTAGFSIVSYTGNFSTATVGHGLGVAPTIVLVKPRNQPYQWLFQTTQIDGSYDFLYLDQTNAKGDLSVSAPTSTVFNLSASDAYNGSGDSLIAYCFAEKKGYSKFGSYTGNGNEDGTFVYTGFKPAWIMVKRTNAVNNWIMFDNKRNTFNVLDKYLYANLTNAEATGDFVDFTSNGFKWRRTGTANAVNGSGGTYIYMAFASNPFVTSTGVPTTAR